MRTGSTLVAGCRRQRQTQTNAVVKHSCSARGSMKSTELSQQKESSGCSRGLGILIVSSSGTICCASMFVLVVASVVLVAKAADTTDMPQMTKPCCCTGTSTRMEHALASCLSSLRSTCLVVLIVRVCVVCVCGRACAHTCGTRSLVYGTCFVSATSC